MTHQQAPPAPEPPSADAVAAVRGFSRFYTRVIGALDEGHLSSPFSLAEVRVLYEVAHRDLPYASDIGRDLRLDAGYLSRLLRTLEERGLVVRTPSPSDGRQSLIALTVVGRTTVDDLEARANAAVASLLATRTAAECARLSLALRSASVVLGDTAAANSQPPYLLRAHGPGDMGWVIARHGVLYADEYQWDSTFEALVARIAADFIDHFDAAREHCWIAERDGVNVGCVFLVKHPDRDGVAKLRMLLVEPEARGLGIGKRLVDECTRFARRSGYHTISLWTNDILVGARQIYQRAGYRLMSEDAHHSFGHDLVGQYWELAL
ncbi:MAG: MarR family transcriptional regulator [Gemmatimonadaceae bacterium]|nr:MarR family transcriptional regulator [Gemmatimonadaceae bacterium]